MGRLIKAVGTEKRKPRALNFGVMVTARIPADDAERLAAIAKARDVTVSELVRRAVDRLLENERRRAA